MIKRLLILNGLAGASIATYHASAYGLSALFEWTDRYMPVSVPNYDLIGSPEYYILLGIRLLNSFAIPAFILMAGYFITIATEGPDSHLKWSVMLTRIRNLLIPFFLWTAIRYILLRQLPTSIDDLLTPYYFLVLLFQFYLLAPLIVPIAKKNWQFLLIVTALIQIGAESLFIAQDLGVNLPPSSHAIIQSLPLWFFPRRLFWLALGIVIGFNRQQFMAWIEHRRMFLLAGAIISGALVIPEYEFYSELTRQLWLGPSFRGFASRIFGVFLIACFLGFNVGRLPLSDKLYDLGGKTMGIYLVNIPAIYVISVILYRQFPWILGNQILYQAILITAGLAIPLVLMHFLRIYRRGKFYHLVFG